LADPANPEHEDLKEWIGGSFDSTAFDVAEVNERLNPNGTYFSCPTMKSRA
jgi:hypothetical protein